MTDAQIDKKLRQFLSTMPCSIEFRGLMDKWDSMSDQQKHEVVMRSAFAEWGKLHGSPCSVTMNFDPDDPRLVSGPVFCEPWESEKAENGRVHWPKNIKFLRFLR